MRDERRREIRKEIVSWVKTILFAVIIALGINFFVIIRCDVISTSMENTLAAGDKVIGLRMAYVFGKPERGDVVIFPSPDDTADDLLYVKRIIGLPGETVEIRDGYVFIDGDVLYEDYLFEPMYGSFGPVTVPEDSYFMLG
ncbi:MAG: signal peptidase I, partial [Lachnospiraceae bacterium]|nr:signal peptidase I [Lachnospiraceae bacterium]